MNLQKKIYSSILFILIYWPVSLHSQTWRNRLCVEGNYHYGFLIPHSDFISFFVKEHIQGVQLNVGIITRGEKSWHQSYNYPLIGVGYHYSGLGNGEIYGQMNAFYAFVDRYYLNRKNKFNFGNKLSLGTAFINKRFDLENNSVNLAIGSKLNAYVNYSFETIYRFFPHLELKLGAGITHVSNGSFRQPNKGLNFLTGFTGITYKFSDPGAVLPTSPERDTLKHQFLVQVTVGNKQISRKLPDSYLAWGLSAEYAHLITGNSWGGAAVTFYYDPSLEKELSMSDTVKTTFSHRIRLALNLSYELKMGRISYVFQPGVYLKNPYKVSGDISNRLSVRYQFTDNLLASFTIKAHWFAIADFFEWGIGYRLKK